MTTTTDIDLAATARALERIATALEDIYAALASEDAPTQIFYLNSKLNKDRPR